MGPPKPVNRAHDLELPTAASPTAIFRTNSTDTWVRPLFPSSLHLRTEGRPEQSIEPEKGKQHRANRRAHGGHACGRPFLARASVPPPLIPGGSNDAAAQGAVPVAAAVPAAGVRRLLAPGNAPAVSAAPELAPPQVEDVGRGAGRQHRDGGRDADAAEAEAARGRGAARRARIGLPAEHAPGEAEAGEGGRGGGGRRSQEGAQKEVHQGLGAQGCSDGTGGGQGDGGGREGRGHKLGSGPGSSGRDSQ
jgi:hypothetical protein